MKKRYCLLLMILFAGSILFAQEIPVAAEQQLENLADAGTEPDDDTYLQEMAYFLKHPVQLNTAGEEELKQLRILNELQVQSLLHYRRLFGPLVNMYELQAIPYW
ncbi:MAG: helix-hairpin-helix domain-containing protein, partial [Chitinophagaceae bacterium]|nr:helix-hairpin-helix domain-containing protein [Chitinophagaceae bacterium]